MSTLVIVKYGEIALKGGNRPAFEQALVRNLRWALRDEPDVRVQKERGRCTVEAPDAEHLLPAVLRVFGVVGASVVTAVPLSMAAMQTAAARELGLAIDAGKRTFKVETKRANKRFPLTSPEISSGLGEFLLGRFPNATVDIHQPEVTISVEVRDRGAYIYRDTYQGPGGLPVGMSSRGLLLISGGIDSPVAGWLAMRRGIRLAGIHFHAAPYTSERARQKVVDLMEVLAAYAGNIPVHMVHFTEAQLALRDKAPAPLLVTLMRRLMLRVATTIAQKYSIPALITGESVGQVASQTLESMAAINAVTNVPVLRPLATFDKAEITTLARRIGTYETSILPYEDCCTLFLPTHPETHPTLQQVAAAEANLDIEGLVQQCVENTELITAHPNTAASLYSGGPIFA